MPTEAYEAYTVVRVPFPFTDRTTTIRRPALVLSNAENFNNRVGHSVMAMITSAGHIPWPLDCPIVDITAAGLPAPSMVRFKLFTLDHRLASGVLGRLAAEDVARVRSAVGSLFDRTPLEASPEERLRGMVDAGLVEWSGRRPAWNDPEAVARGDQTVADILLTDRE